MNVTCKEYENFSAEERDCLLELVRLYELESDKPQVTWEAVIKSFNETTGKIINFPPILFWFLISIDFAFFRVKLFR